MSQDGEPSSQTAEDASRRPGKLWQKGKEPRRGWLWVGGAGRWFSRWLKWFLALLPSAVAGTCGPEAGAMDGAWATGAVSCDRCRKAHLLEAVWRHGRRNAFLSPNAVDAPALIDANTLRSQSGIAETRRLVHQARIAG